MQNISKLISNNYNINIKSIDIAPRGFVGETYIINTENYKYFLKIFKNNRYFTNVLQALPVLEELKDLGINYINYPLPTKEKALYFSKDKRFYILFNYIEGENTQEIDVIKGYEYLIKIHKLTKKIKSPIKKETFDIAYKKEFEKGLRKYESIPLIEEHLEEVKKHWELFKQLSNRLKRKSFNMYITHGDAFGNFIKQGKDLYIIDWDDLLLAPIERDLWFFFENTEVVDLYEKKFPGFIMNKDIIMYYIYNRFFDDMLGFFELLDEGQDREEVIKDIKKDCFDWTYKLFYDLEGF